ncbi:hypothetical protein BKA70DRAFT_755165 [Coprinopsis sp. MPI-PUGE-AT-0042]|nr:hypothetical protein BKA70DRAFT_755165 [Coprinopsis sp. MPI-PUGE-AT-0042]
MIHQPMSTTLSSPKQDALIDHHKILPWPDLGDSNDFNPDHYLNDFDDLPGGDDALDQSNINNNKPEVASSADHHQPPKPPSSEHGDRSSSLSPVPDSSIEQSRREEEEEDENSAAAKQQQQQHDSNSLSRPLTPLSPLSPPPQEEEEDDVEEKKESVEDRKPTRPTTSASPAPAQPPTPAPENDPKAPLLIDLNNELFAIVQALLGKGLTMSDPTLRHYYQRLSGNLMYSSQALESHNPNVPDPILEPPPPLDGAPNDRIRQTVHRTCFLFRQRPCPRTRQHQSQPQTRTARRER